MLEVIRKILRHIRLDEELVTGAFFVVLLIIIGISAYGYERLVALEGELGKLETKLAFTADVLQGAIREATTSVGMALEQEQRNVRSQIGDVQGQVGSITGTVTDLQKLSKIDPELLEKYSKVFFLSENYVPAQLIDIPASYRYVEKNELRVIPQILPYLVHMLDAARADNVSIYVQSAYRSFGTQSTLKSQYTVTYGAGTANAFSADQGYSEHQLGTTVDLITTGLGGQLTGFEKTGAYAWLVANAYRFGFVLSYPPGNNYYVFEPWHWRFVGLKLAADLHTSGTYFYSMDQRTLDSYLINLFD